MFTDSKVLIFNINEKNIYYSHLFNSLENIIQYYNDVIDENTVGTDDITKMVEFIRTETVLNPPFNTLYNSGENIYENNQDNNLKYILFKPSSEEECKEIQEYAFENGWSWSGGQTTILYPDSGILIFNNGYDKFIYRSFGTISIEKQIEFYKDKYNINVGGTDNINTIKLFLRTKIFSNTSFDDIYTKRENIYESIEDGIQYISVLLPTDLNDKLAYVKTIEEKGWIKKNTSYHPNIVDDLNEANILHIFCGHFDKEFIYVKYDSGIENFVEFFFRNIDINKVKIITSGGEFLKTFDTKYLKWITPSFSDIYNKRENIYESIEYNINYIIVLLPENLSDKLKYINSLEECGWKEKNIIHGSIVVENLEDANILYIFSGKYDKEYVYIKYDDSIENFVKRTFNDNVKVITTEYDFLKTFDSEYFNMVNLPYSNTYDKRKNIYE